VTPHPPVGFPELPATHYLTTRHVVVRPARGVSFPYLWVNGPFTVWDCLICTFQLVDGAFDFTLPGRTFHGRRRCTTTLGVYGLEQRYHRSRTTFRRCPTHHHRLPPTCAPTRHFWLVDFWHTACPPPPALHTLPPPPAPPVRPPPLLPPATAGSGPLFR